MQMSLGHFIGQWLEILRKLSRQNWNVEKLLLARSRVCRSAQRDACCMLAGYSLLLLGMSERVQITLCIIIQTI